MESSRKDTQEYASLQTIPRDVDGEGEEKYSGVEVSFDQDEFVPGPTFEDGKYTQEYAPFLSFGSNVDGEDGYSFVKEDSFKKEFGDEFVEDSDFWYSLHTNDCGMRSEVLSASQWRDGKQDSNHPNEERRKRSPQVTSEGASSVEPVSPGNKQEDSAVQKPSDDGSRPLGVEMEGGPFLTSWRVRQPAYFKKRRSE
ncbi:hypothetical protein QFC19_001072 [Naganishia cerealis]|uniref:Uncharacterized protein n=1 Tax=Naganishia cerealis TaxID=610337 RepID=A0ACC2WJ92_9TREE|nr:hypothetical protein QFC19_001072 [Naganishia cerealis]